MARNTLSPEARAARIKLVLELRALGRTQRDIAAKLGITQPGLSAFELSAGIRDPKFRRTPSQKAKLRPRNWGVEKGDPSTLTPEQLETARRTGITPERFAWLCACPRDPNAKRGAVGHRGGAAIG